MIGKVTRLAVTIIVLALIVFGITANIKLINTPHVLTPGQTAINQDIRKELLALKHAISNHADVEMQKIYPEGFVFLNAIYGLSWCRFLETVDRKTTAFATGLTEISRAWMKINSPEARSVFEKDLSIEHGAYYTGWNNYLLGSRLMLEEERSRRENEISQFRVQCEAIAQGITRQAYPESYRDASWPADVVICVASLALHDKMFGPKYDLVIEQWMLKVKSNLDANGLIPHAANSQTGSPQQNARGSSQSLMLIFLREIDTTFASQQFHLFKEKFIDTKFGFTGVREYPKGVRGNGDIDSGPVLFDMGAAATIVGMQTLALYGEYEQSTRIRNELEMFGWSTEDENGKRYLFGLMPMADAFIVWGHTSMSFTTDQQPILFSIFHTVSLIVLALLFYALWRMWRFKLLKVRNVG